MKGFDFRFNTVVGLLFGVAILAILFGLFKRTGLRADLRPPPRDGSKLFAFRFTLSCAFLGLSVAWLTTQPAYSWPIWGLLTYFGASGVICYLVFGVRNGRWIYRISAPGQMDGIKVVQTFFLIAGPGGEQIVVAFTMTPAQAEKLGTRDLALINGLMIVSAKAKE